jgi:hypothetical protein
MYAIKQAMLLSGALPLADLTIYYMDIRAFGKGYEQFFQNAKAMGIEFVKAKPCVVGQAGDQGVILRYEDQYDGRMVERNHDLVVMSLAMLPADRHEASIGMNSGPGWIRGHPPAPSSPRPSPPKKASSPREPQAVPRTSWTPSWKRAMRPWRRPTTWTHAQSAGKAPKGATIP